MVDGSEVTILVDGPVDGLITPVGIALDLPQVAPDSGNRYCITGTSTEVAWGWELVDPTPPGTVKGVGKVAPVAAGGTASDIVGAWVDSINLQVPATPSTAKQQNTCFRIKPTGLDLYVDGCKITGSSSGCSFNPTVFDATGVGGTVELLGQSEPPADASESSARDYTAPIAAAVVAGALALAAGGWYARRRWIR